MVRKELREYFSDGLYRRAGFGEQIDFTVSSYACRLYVGSFLGRTVVVIDALRRDPEIERTSRSDYYFVVADGVSITSANAAEVCKQFLTRRNRVSVNDISERLMLELDEIEGERPYERETPEA